MIGFVLAAALAVAPAPTGVAGRCDHSLTCRHVTEFQIRNRDGKPLTVKVDADVDYVSYNHLMLLPGEMVVIDLKERPGLAPLISVLEAGRADSIPTPAVGTAALEAGKLPPGSDEQLKNRGLPQKGVRLSFTQLADGGMLLIVESAYDRRLDYHAYMTVPEGKRLPTSLCELMPKVPSYESWPHPIVGLEIGDFQFLDGASDQLTCD